MPWKPAEQVEQPSYAPPEQNVPWWQDLFTGQNRTEFPETPEFSSAYSRQMLSPGGQSALSDTRGIYSPEIRGHLLQSHPQEAVDEAEQFFKGYQGVSKSQLTSDPRAQLDILRKAIPGLETRPDKYGNIMVRAPGMKDFTYLNKPGLTERDLEEFGAQSWATFPALAMAGAGSGPLRRAVAGATGLAASSVGEDLLATEAGSEQGVSPEKALLSAGVGALTAGVAEPLIGRTVQAAGKAFSYPISHIRSAVNPEGEARRRVMGAARDDARRGQLNLNSSQVAAARTRGQDPRVMDVGGETIRAEARRAANMSPVARQGLTDFISERFENQGLRLGEFISRLVRRSGATRGPNAFLTREQLKTAARNSRNPLYRSAYAQGAQGLSSPAINRLSQAPAIQQAMKTAQSEMRNRVAAGRSKGAMANGKPTLEFWDLTKRRLDDRIRELKRNGRNSEALDLDSLRKQLLKELDTLVPDYAKARGTAATYFGAEDALEAGENFVKGRYDLSQARKALNDMTERERELFAEGFASRFINEVGRMRDRRNLLGAINASEDARERMIIALGPNRYRDVESFLRVEQFMDFVRTALGNSTTARQLLEMGGLGYGLYNNDPTALMLSALSLGSRWAGGQIDRRVAEKVVEQLLSRDVNTFLKGVRQISSSPLLNALRAFDNYVGRTGLARTIGARQGAEQLSVPENAPVSPPSDAAPGGPLPQAPIPQQPPGNGPPIGPNQVTAPASPPPGGQASAEGLMGPQDAYRLAQEAIQRGAPVESVQQRLMQYGYDPRVIA